jgi:hypothetical protein
MRIFALLFSILIGINSSFSQTSIVGKWKVVKVTYRDDFQKRMNVIYDTLKNDSITQVLFEKNINQDSLDSESFKKDSIQIIRKLEKMYNKQKGANLLLRKNGTFLMNSYGLIIPNVQPGWVFGDKLIGRWVLKNNLLELTIGGKKMGTSFFYRVIHMETNALILGQTNQENAEPYNEMQFHKE